jgi:thiosulfate dehydrogenase [quinone] large subunit
MAIPYPSLYPSVSNSAIPAPAALPTTPYLRRNADGTVDYHERIVLAPPDRPASSADAVPRRRTVSSATGQGQTGPARSGGRVNVVLAAMQVLVGYQWLVSGGDKLLYGHFPDELGQLVATATSSGRLPDFFAQFLQSVVLPSATIFGVLIEYGEALAGLGLLAGALLTLARPLIVRRLAVAEGSGARFARFGLGAMSVLTAGAALGAFFMGLNYWALDGMPAPWFAPGLAYGGAIHPALFLAGACAAILIGQIASQIAAARRR